MSDYIGTRILEVCECPESVTDQSNGFGRVLGGKNSAKTGLAPNSRKSGSLQKVSQTDALALRHSQEFKTVLNSIGKSHVKPNLNSSLVNLLEVFLKVINLIL